MHDDCVPRESDHGTEQPQPVPTDRGGTRNAEPVDAAVGTAAAQRSAVDADDDGDAATANATVDDAADGQPRPRNVRMSV